MIDYSEINALLFFKDNDIMYEFIDKLNDYPTLSKYKQLIFNINEDDLNNLDQNEKYKIFQINDLNEIDDSFFIIDNVENENEYIEDIQPNYIHTQPDISIITCLYNTPPELFQPCINSMIEQTFTNWECIIYNDGSDKYLEENLEFINSLNDDRFKIFHKEHSGKSNTLNEAINVSIGKYIAIWDSDDQFIPERLKYQYNWLENHYNYDALCNSLIDKNHYVWPGMNLDSQDITNDNVHWVAFHPCMMFNKENVLLKVPYLFDQTYDSMEDNIFNHIMFYNGCKIRYENNVLGEYCIKNSNAAHKDNLYGYLKYIEFNLKNKCFNFSETNHNLTCIIMLNKNWYNELEKTLMNIRLTSDSVNIIVMSSYNNTDNKEICNRYSVTLYEIPNKSYCELLSQALELSLTDLVFVISNPIRFCVTDWDRNIVKYFKYAYKNEKNNIIQPYMFDMEKISNNKYLNSRGKYERHNIRCGERLVLMTNELTEKIDEIKQYNEYVTKIQIPILDDDLCFYGKKDIIKECIRYCSDRELLNVYISLYNYVNCNANIYIDLDIKCSVENIYNNVNYLYWKNFIAITYLYFNELSIIYEHIFNESLNEDILQNIKNYIENDENIQHAYNNINRKKLKDFLKNINHKQTWLI